MPKLLRVLWIDLRVRKWGRGIRLSVRSGNAPGHIFQFPPEIRTLIYTTNSIEGLNRAIRKVIKPRTLFPSEDAARKLIYLAIRNYTETWMRASTRWSSAMPQFALLFGERFTNAME